MKIKEFINLELIKKNGDNSFQSKSVKALIYIFIIMILFTFLSRFANSLTVPIVQTGTSTSKEIVHEINIEGIFEENKQIAISSIEGIEISNINVNKGTAVKTGDILFELNLDKIKEKVTSLNTQIQSKNKMLTRVKEDYDYAFKNETEKIESLLSEMNEVKSKLDSYNNAEGTSKDELSKAYEEKKKAYDEELKTKTNVLLVAKRSLEDAQNDSELQQLKANLEKVNNLLNSEGKVLSTVAGTVTNINISKGELTPIGTCISVADISTGLKFNGSVLSEDGKDIKVGQSVKLSVGDNNEDDETLVVNSVSVDAQDKKNLNISVLIPSGVGEIGDLATAKITKSKKEYFCCIPLESLRTDGKKYYILTLEEKDTVLGTETIAKRVDVEIQDKDDRYAAINDSSLGGNEEIIISSNKNINEGDVVRKEVK